MADPVIDAPPDKVAQLAALRQRARELAEAERLLTAPKWDTPGVLATAVEPSTVQTPALDIVDDALVWAYTTPGARLLISMPPQEGKPLIVSTMILMGDGSRKPLADVRRGDYVISHSGRPCRVTAVHEQGKLPIVKITTHAGRVIRAATDHPFLTAGGWVNAGDLTPGDALAVVHAPATTATAALPAEAARLLGYFVGDGNTTASAANLNAAITCVDGREYADILHCAGALGFTTTLRPKRVLMGGGVRQWLRQHGLAGCTSWTKRVPPEIFRQPPEIIAEFIGAYFACDGTVSRRGGARPDCRLEFNSVSRDLLSDIQHLLLRLSITATLRPKHTTVSGKPYTSWRLLIRRQDDAARFRDLVPFIHSKAETLAAWPLRRTEFDGPYFSDMVTAVETDEAAECRCLTVQGDHTFTAWDVVVHNSQRATKTGTLWALTRDPERRIGVASYAQSLAESFGREIRNWITTFDGTEGTLDLGLRIAPDYGSARRWQLDGHRGGVICVGIGSGLTGRPLDALVIDDPFADKEQADSAYYRDRVWEWYQSVGAPRLAPGAPVIVILTRWHEDDIAGRLIAAEDGDRWRVINIPALADHDPARGETDPLGRMPGEWLESARGRSDEEWEQIRIQSGSRVFAALYQGRPSPDQGNVWLRHWWRRYETPLWSQDPARPGAYRVNDADEVLMSWDMAFADTKGSDFVVGQVWARRGADVFLLDQVRKRLSFTDTVTAFRAMVARWPQAARKLVENKANGPAVISTLKSKIPGIVAVTPVESKYARATAVAPFIEAGNAFIPAGEIALFDVAEFIDETASFPNHAHDDQVDATSQALREMLLDGSGAMAWIAYARRRAEAAARAPAAATQDETPETPDAPATPPLTPLAGMAAALLAPGVTPGTDPGIWHVRSSDGTRTYTVTPEGCDCNAGEHGKPCRHRRAAAAADPVTARKLARDEAYRARTLAISQTGRGVRV